MGLTYQVRLLGLQLALVLSLVWLSGTDFRPMEEALMPSEGAQYPTQLHCVSRPRKKLVKVPRGKRTTTAWVETCSAEGV